jgi:hypothetical protein
VPLPAGHYARSPQVLRRNPTLSGVSDGQESLSSSASDSEGQGLADDVAKAKESRQNNKTSNIIKVLEP